MMSTKCQFQPATMTLQQIQKSEIMSVWSGTTGHSLFQKNGSIVVERGLDFPLLLTPLKW